MIKILLLFSCFTQIRSTFPPFYNISSRGGASHQYSEVFGMYAMGGQTGDLFPIYQKVSMLNDGEYLYQHEGTFFVSGKIYSRGNLRLENQDDPVSNNWEYKNQAGEWTRDHLFKLTPLENPNPDSYMVTSTGPAAKVYPNYFGLYNKTEDSCHGYPIYAKQSPRKRYLHLNSQKQWTVSRDSRCNTQTAAMRHSLKGSPFPETSRSWMYYTFVGFVGKYEVDSQMMVYNADRKEHLDDGEDTSTDSSNNVVVIIVSVFFSVLIVVLLSILVVQLFIVRNLRKRSFDASEQETFDNNPVYGHEEYDEETKDSGMVDRNDYYGH